jgi:hypothetical protein
MPEEKDTEYLREKLEDYYGTAAASGLTMALVELAEVSSMSDEEVLEKAEQLHLD